MTESTLPRPQSPTVADPAATRAPFPTRQASRASLQAGYGWRATQLGADLATVFLAAAATYLAYLESGVGQSHYDPGRYLGIMAQLAVIVVFGLYGLGAYRGQLGLLQIESVRRVIKAVFWGVMLILSFSFFRQTGGSFSRVTMLAVGPVVVMALIVQRWFLWKLARRIRAARGAETPVLVYGAGETGRLVAQHLNEEHALGMKVAAYLDDDPGKRGEMVRAGAGVNGEKIEVLGGEAELDAALERTGACAVFLAMPSANSARNAHLAAVLERRGIPFFLVPSAGALLFSTLSFGQLGSLPVFTRRSVQITRAYLATKRAIDLAGAAALLLVSAPALAVGALLVKLTSPGPVFFRQDRIGRGGEPFVIWKLRTMRTDAPKYAYHPGERDDPRITPVGRWLRRLSIDELPQLWNVLRGEMSLVGPRPEMPFIVAEYGDIERQRLTVKPGVTGLWQISADRAFRIHDNIHYDVYYVENRSLTLDLAILVMTPFALLPGGRAI